jgi:hypothetical protein
MTKIRSISSPDDCERIFELITKIKPYDVSFSRILAVAAQEYINNHKKDNTKISDFVSKDMSNTLPEFFGEIEKWKKVIEKLPPSELKKIQVRHRQIDTMIRKKVESFL